MKKRCVMASVLACSMLFSSCLSGCRKKSEKNDSTTTETEEERIDLGSTSATSETTVSDQAASLTALTCPDTSSVQNDTFYKQIKINPQKDIPTLFQTYPDLACCCDDGVWFYISTGHFMKYDYEGKLLHSVRLSAEDRQHFEEDYYMPGDMYVQDGVPHIIYLLDGCIQDYKLDPDTGTLEHVRTYDPPIQADTILNPIIVGITEDEIYIYVDSAQGSGAVVLASYPWIVGYSLKDGQVLKKQVQKCDNAELLGGWMIDGQFHSVITNEGYAMLSPLTISPSPTHYLDHFPYPTYTTVNGSNQYIIDSKGLWVMNRDSGEWSNTFLWTNTDYDPNDYGSYRSLNFYGTRYKISPDGKKLLIFHPSIPESTSLFVASEDPRENRTVITLSCEAKGSEDLMKTIRAFNEENKDYYIQVAYESFDPNSYPLSPEDPIDLRTAVKSETERSLEQMKAGKGPVLFVQKILHHSSPYFVGTSEDQLFQKVHDEIFAHKEFFKDMRPLWEALDPLWRDQFIRTPYSSGSDTPMYSVPYSVDEVFFEDVCSLSMSQNIAGCFSGNQDNSYITWLNTLNQNYKDKNLSPSYSSETMLFYMLSNDLSAFTKADGTVDLHDPQFRALLELCSTYFVHEDGQFISGIKPIFLNVRHYPVPFIDYAYDDKAIDYRMTNKGVFMKFPSASGENNMTFVDQQFRISASASQEEVDGAWAFIRYALEKNSNLKWDRFKEGLKAFEHPSDYFDFWKRMSLESYIEPQYILPVSQEQIESYEKTIADPDQITIPDTELYKIICEETADYMQGKESIDDAIEKLQKRINEYLK